ncbi:hypothetical protein cypCar_00044016 [Cyprinus carpio]|nr:hypothetical protein cypCar_00044016 [Cyprinus carpio]
MEFIKEESEDLKIEETLKHEDTDEHTEIAFIKTEDMKIEAAFTLRYEDLEDNQTEMEFIKEETEDVKIEEDFRVEHEDTETQTGIALVYRRIQKTGTAVQSLTGLSIMIGAVGRAVSTETLNRNMDNITEKLTALQRQWIDLETRMD